MNQSGEKYGLTYSDFWGIGYNFTFADSKDLNESIERLALRLMMSCAGHPLRNYHYFVQDPLGNDLVRHTYKSQYSFLDHFLARACFLYDFTRKAVELGEKPAEMSWETAVNIAKALVDFHIWIGARCKPLLGDMVDEVELCHEDWKKHNRAFLNLWKKDL